MADAPNVPSAVDEAATTMMPAAQASEPAAPAHAGQETFLGRPVPVAAYTVVYVILAVTSLIEVLLAESIAFDSWVRVPLLAGLSALKAVLVMAYYMHLKDDSKIFAGAIILPIVVGLIATLFLLSVPPTY